ncbi:hypothetical protein Bca4012_070122 [Brassica carinata]
MIHSDNGKGDEEQTWVSNGSPDGVATKEQKLNNPRSYVTRSSGDAGHLSSAKLSNSVKFTDSLLRLEGRPAFRPDSGGQLMAVDMLLIDAKDSGEDIDIVVSSSQTNEERLQKKLFKQATDFQRNDSHKYFILDFSCIPYQMVNKKPPHTAGPKMGPSERLKSRASRGPSNNHQTASLSTKTQQGT